MVWRRELEIDKGFSNIGTARDVHRAELVDQEAIELQVHLQRGLPFRANLENPAATEMAS